MATIIESGLYSGDTRTIIADSPIVDYMFDQWTGDIGALNDETLPTAIVNMSSTNVVVTATYKLIPPALKLTWDSILNVPVANASSVSDWNLFFDLPINGGEFTSVAINGNEVNLIGGSAINLRHNLFENLYPITAFLKIEDGIDCVIAADVNAFGGNEGSNCQALTTISLPNLTTGGYACFAGLPSLVNLYLPEIITADLYCFTNSISDPNYALTSVSFPNLTTIGDGSFRECYNLTNINLPICTNLGSTTGNDNIFTDIIGNTITLTIPSALMTCDGGSPDVDIQYLIDNNNVTINGVSYIPRTLTVNHGIGSGVYIQNNIVPISAGTSTIEYLWNVWTGDTANIDNVSGNTTFITMPDADVTIDATYAQDTAFIFKATMPATAVTLPLPSGVYTYNFTVDWGDGSALGTVTSYNDVDAIHTYATSGNTYYVKIKGMCQGLALIMEHLRHTLKKLIIGEHVILESLIFMGVII